MKVTLIQPAIGRRKGKKFKRPITLEPLSIATIAGVTPDDVELKFYDDRIEDINFDDDADLVGISVETSTALRSYEIARKFRDKGIPIVMGGVHPTLLPQEVSNHADIVVSGQAEDIWPELLSDFESGTLKQFYKNGSPTLEKITTDRKVFEGKRYLPFHLIEFGRGCPFKCEFCDIPVYYDGKYSTRPLDNLVSEIEESGKNTFVIVDDNLGSNSSILEEFCEKISPLNINWVSQTSITLARNEKLLDKVAESGCKGFLIGFESINEANLVQMNKRFNTSIPYETALKRFNERGIRIHGSFIVGYDNDTEESIDRLVDFAIDQKLYIANFNPLTPIPKTQLYERLKNENRLINEKWWLDYNFRYGDFVFTPKQMSAEAMAAKCEEAKDRFYSVKGILKRGLGSDTNINGLRPTLAYLGFNLLARREIKLKSQAYLGLEKDINRIDVESIDSNKYLELPISK